MRWRCRIEQPLDSLSIEMHVVVLDCGAQRRVRATRAPSLPIQGATQVRMPRPERLCQVAACWSFPRGVQIQTWLPAGQREQM
jgi:hypothetical protein